LQEKLKTKQFVFCRKAKEQFSYQLSANFLDADCAVIFRQDNRIDRIEKRAQRQQASAAAEAMAGQAEAQSFGQDNRIKK
jgi:hypothetical protein